MISGYGTSTGFSMNLQDKTGGDLTEFYNIYLQFIGALNQRPEIARAYSTFNINFPQYMVDIDAAKAKRAGVSPTSILSTLAGYYGYDLDGLVQNLLGYESTDDMLAHLESSLENYSKEALLYQAVAESLDITPTQEQLDAYSDYKDTYGSNYCTMVALMDAVTDTLTSGAVVS